MRKLEMTAFNKTLKDELDDLKNLVARNITPENINFMPESLLKRVDNLIDVWGKDSDINSVSTNKLQTLIEHLKIRQVETTFVNASILNEISGTQNVDVEVPEGFDGRNSFVQITNTSGKTPSEVLQDKLESELGDAINERNKFSIHKNKSTIRISLQSNTSGQTYVPFIFFWRTK